MTENPKHLLERASESSQRPSKIAKTAIEELSDDEVEQQQLQQPPAKGPMSPNSRIQRYLVAIEYIGTRFSGSQKQPNIRTVVGVLEEAFHKFIGQPVSIFCSSRTDAGVHALSNVCHVDVERISKRKPGEVLPPHEPVVVRRAVNHFLQVLLDLVFCSLYANKATRRTGVNCITFLSSLVLIDWCYNKSEFLHVLILEKNEGDIMVVDVQCVPADFHARYKALERTYFYRLHSGPEPLSTFERDRAWHVPEEMDILAMQEASKVLVGHHDFSSFRAAGCQAKSPMRTLDELNISEVVPNPYFPTITERRQNNLTLGDLHASSNKSETGLSPSSISIGERARGLNGAADLGFGIRRRHRCFVVTARARSFLYHQVRLLVGVLKAVGTGDLTVSDVERILNAKTVTAASPMAPSCGLYLGHVKYDLP